MALFRLDMLILKRMQLASPAGVPATISFQTARLSSAGLLRCLDSIPSMRSCRARSVKKAMLPGGGCTVCTWGELLHLVLYLRGGGGAILSAVLGGVAVLSAVLGGVGLYLVL